MTPTSSSVTMLFTLNEHCNWNCWYCNQGHNKKKVILDITKYKIILLKFKNTIMNHKIKIADYIFMGGELCLLPNLNDYFTDISKYLAPSNITDTSFTIVTNFSCENRKYIELFNILNNQGIKAKLGISAHEDYIINDEFIAKINNLKKYNIELSVGVLGGSIKQKDLISKLKMNKIEYTEDEIQFDSEERDALKLCDYQGYTILPNATIVEDCSQKEFNYLTFKIDELIKECDLVCPACIKSHNHEIKKEYI